MIELELEYPMLKGEKGDKGDKGDTGDKGDKGDKGDAYTITQEDYGNISDVVIQKIGYAEEVGF